MPSVEAIKTQRTVFTPWKSCIDYGQVRIHNPKLIYFNWMRLDVVRFSRAVAYPLLKRSEGLWITSHGPYSSIRGHIWWIAKFVFENTLKWPRPEHGVIPGTGYVHLPSNFLYEMELHGICTFMKCTRKEPVTPASSVALKLKLIKDD